MRRIDWHAHPKDQPEFDSGTWLRMGIAGIVGAPLLWAFMVVFLSAMGSPNG